MQIDSTIQQQAAMPSGEENLKPESEVMSMNIDPSMIEALEAEETPATPEVENKTTSNEVKETEIPSSEDVKAPGTELTDEEKSQLSEKAQKRIRELNEKAKLAEENAKRAEELEAEVERLKSSQEERFVNPYADATIRQPLFGGSSDDSSSFGEVQQPQPHTDTSRLPWDTTPTVPQFEEKVLSPEEYQRDVLNAADIIVQARMQQYAKANEIQTDLERVEGKYPELNPSSSEFSEETSTKISALFETQLRANPNTRLASFVDNIMSLRNTSAKRAAEKVKTEISAKVVEQKAEEAITPHEVEPTPEKPFEQMTLDEKEAYLKDKGLW